MQQTTVHIDKGHLAGKGVYAARDFLTGEIVVNYNLTALTEEQFNALPESEKMFTHIQHGATYLYGEPERYVNHSNDPNTLPDHILHADVAIRDIRQGEMITTDSRLDDVAETDFFSPG